MGHSSIVMTMDRYGHLFPGNEKDSAEKLDAFLGQERAPFRGEPRGEEVPGSGGSVRNISPTPTRARAHRVEKE